MELELSYLRETVMDTLTKSLNNDPSRNTASVSYIRLYEGKSYLFVKRKSPTTSKDEECFVFGIRRDVGLSNVRNG